MLLTVATVVVAEVHGVVAFAVPDPVSWVVEPRQTLKVPVIVGNGFTVTVAVIVQPFVFL